MITIIISTLSDRFFGIDLPPKNDLVQYIIIHQERRGSDVNIAEFLKRDDVKYHQVNSLGLSKSRNFGLDAVKTKYAYIMDDDVIFEPSKIIELVKLMNEGNVDVATCQFCYESGGGSRYKSESFKHSILSVAKVSSIEICINVEAIKSNGIRFNENFGLGTDLPSGEEYIFLTDCLKSKLNVWYFPILTCTHPNVTSGLDFYTSANKVLAKREMIKHVFGKKAFFYIFAFWIKKFNIVRRSGCFSSFTKTMLFGWRC
ncbi:glycosyltransferase [Zobellella denitrificans]